MRADRPDPAAELNSEKAPRTATAAGFPRSRQRREREPCPHLSRFAANENAKQLLRPMYRPHICSRRRCFEGDSLQLFAIGKCQAFTALASTRTAPGTLPSGGLPDAASLLAESLNFLRRLAATWGFDTAGDIHGLRPGTDDRLPNILRSQAAC